MWRMGQPVQPSLPRPYWTNQQSINLHMRQPRQDQHSPNPNPLNRHMGDQDKIDQGQPRSVRLFSLLIAS
jgi:hypothetical protein